MFATVRVFVRVGLRLIEALRTGPENLGTKMWWSRMELNHRPSPPEGVAAPSPSCGPQIGSGRFTNDVARASAYPAVHTAVTRAVGIHRSRLKRTLLYQEAMSNWSGRLDLNQ